MRIVLVFVEILPEAARADQPALDRSVIQLTITEEAYKALKVLQCKQFGQTWQRIFEPILEIHIGIPGIMIGSHWIVVTYFDEVILEVIYERTNRPPGFGYAGWT